MSDQLSSTHKTQFQLERLILFSDAVFAIAITLLVIEIKVPELHGNELTEMDLLQALGHLIPKFFGFIISFMFIGIYWTVHHRLFGYVVNYDRKLLRLNLFFLFAIALMPFSTAFYSEYVIHRMFTPVVFYTGNIVLLGIINLMMWRHIARADKGLTENFPREESRYYSTRAILVPLLFTIFAFLYLWMPRVAMYLPITIPFIMRALARRHRQKTANIDR